jgi:hypothetical protein
VSRARAILAAVLLLAGLAACREQVRVKVRARVRDSGVTTTATTTGPHGTP